MRKFRILRPVLDCQGYQIFVIEAKNEADAIKRCAEAKYEDEEVEVTHLGAAEIVEEITKENDCDTN
jgi:hypothetical protein